MEKRNNVKYYIRQAKSFDVVIFDMKIPKNAIYGREQNTYYYIDNFEQFKNVKDRYEIFIFTLKDDYFRKVLMIKNNTIMRKVIKYVKDVSVGRNQPHRVALIQPFLVGDNQPISAKQKKPLCFRWFILNWCMPMHQLNQPWEKLTMT